MKKYFIAVIIILIIGLGIYFYYWHFAKLPSEKEENLYTGRIRLASWNLRVFADESRDNDELRQICQILIDYDFIAMIELKDEPVLRRTQTMLKIMGKDYDYQLSGEVGRKAKERYAFLYNKDRIKVVDPGRIFPDPDDGFIREPFYATFRSGRFDFTVIAVHIIWGDKVSERRAEIQKLADVYSQIQEMNPSEQDVILVGDFNREPDDEQAYAQLRSIPSMMNLFNLPEKSIILDSNLYDNIWFQSSYLSEYEGVHGIDRFDETDFANNDKIASLVVSDHRPVWAEFDASRDDD